MYYKLTNGRVNVSTGVNRTPDGAPVSNFTAWLDDLPAEQRMTLGWYSAFVTQEHPEGHYKPSYVVDGDSIVLMWEETEAPPEPEPQPFQISKVLLRQNLRALGLEGALNDLLASDAEMAADWNDAVTLDSDDPKVVGAFAALVGEGVLDEDDVEYLLEGSRSEYQT